MNPFYVFEYRAEKLFKSKAHFKGGKNPKWDDKAFAFTVENILNDEFYIKVFSRGAMNNQVNAFVRIELKQILDRSQKFDFWADLQYGNWQHNAGIVHI